MLTAQEYLDIYISWWVLPFVLLTQKNYKNYIME